MQQSLHLYICYMCTREVTLSELYEAKPWSCDAGKLSLCMTDNKKWTDRVHNLWPEMCNNHYIYDHMILLN